MTGTDYAIGGLVGFNFGSSITKIEYSYATGSVSGGDSVGGLVGRNSEVIENSYATGSVSGASPTGGLTSDDYYGDGSSSNSFWDTQSTGQSSSVGGVGLTTSEMQGSPASSNMSGFDFADVWVTVDGAYPDLRNNPR